MAVACTAIAAPLARLSRGVPDAAPLYPSLGQAGGGFATEGGKR